ncbi:MAG TPA: DUF1549 domain-containing protein [Gemmataceae bacterium]|nr:DUF1549 domain-containing protein [Gemmataceae bacterium]
MRPARLALPALLMVAGLAPAADVLPPDRPIPDVIDHYVDAKLQRSGTTPAPQADDYTLIRRLTLDLVGRIPTPPETRAYVESTDPAKREKLVDRLMGSPAFVRQQAAQFDAMLAGPSTRGGSGLRDYLTRALGENRPWDQIFRELLLPDESDARTKGAQDFLRSRVTDSDRVTNDVSVVFFGVNVSCAQCHDHPLVADWKQDHFYGMKSFFARTFDNGGFLAEREFGLVKFKPNKGSEKTAKMMFLTGTTVDGPGVREPTKDEEKKERETFDRFKKEKKSPPPPGFSARAKLVEVTLQTKESEFFARSIANRLWHRFLGYGLVMPLDQMHSENKPSHSELLSWLARDVSAHKYDLRRTMRGIVLSQTYSRSSKCPSEAVAAPSLFAVGRLKPLTPTQMATSLKIATADPKTFENVKPEDLEKRLDALESSARGFASSFAQPTDDFQVGVNEALLFSNSDKLAREFLADGNDRLLGRAKSMSDPAKAIDLIVRSVLSRPPTADEQKTLLEYVNRRGDRQPEAYRQVIWALIGGAEFRFNY